MENKEKFESFFDLSLKRAYEVSKTSNPTELADVLGISRQAFYKARGRSKMPRTWAEKLRDLYGANPEWILEGKGAPRMAEHHHNLGSALHVMRSGLISMILDWSPRYGVRSKPVKMAYRLLETLDELRCEMDRLAFDECPDIPKDDRLDLYYQGQAAPTFDPTADQPTPPDLTSRLALEVREFRSELEKAGLTPDEIRKAVMANFARPQPRPVQYGGQVREPEETAVHEPVDRPFFQYQTGADSEDKDSLTDK